MSRRLILIVVLLIQGVGSLTAAEPVEREEHFDVVKLLIDKSLRLPAERAIAEYKATGYANDAFFVKGLEFYYADVFRSLVADKTLGARLEKQRKEIYAYLEGNKEELPGRIARLIDTTNSIKQYTKSLQDQMNPDSPPPLPQAKWTEVEAREFYAKLQRMLEVADKAMDAAYAKIQTNRELELKFDLPEEQRKQVDRKGTFLRYDYVQILYPVYQVTRDVAMRGKAYGLDSTSAKEMVERWFHDKLKQHGEEYSQWDWNYGIYFPFLRHRLNVIRSEAIRLNLRRPGLGQIDADTSYEDVKRQLQEVVDTDLKLYQDEQTRQSVDYLKLEAWGDLLHWHLGLGEDQYLQTGLELWEKFQERSYKLQYANNVYKEYLVGHAYILAARIHHAMGSLSMRDALLAEVKGADNYLADNAQLWINFYNSGPGEAWTKVPNAMPSEAALNLSAAMWSKYNQSIDPEERQRFALKAIANLRNGIKGLPADGGPEFLEYAPRLYQRYAVFLYKLDWYYQASLVAEEGLQRFQPHWKSESDNAWITDGQLSEAGALVKELANNFLSFSTLLKHRVDSRYANTMVDNAIELLKVFDPEAAKDLDWWRVVLAMQNGRYDDAIQLAEEYMQRRPKQKVKALGVVVTARYRLLERELKSEDPDQREVEIRGKRLDTVLDKLVAILEPVIQGDQSAPEGQADMYAGQWRTVLSIKVARLMKEERYADVFGILDEDFWKAPPPDRTLHRQMVSNLAIAAYKIVSEVAGDRERMRDVAAFLANWEHFILARRQYRKLVQMHPGLKGARVRNIRQALGQVFNVCKRQADFFAQAASAGTEGYEDLDAERLACIAVIARLYYADVMLIEEDTEPSILLSIGNSLWNITEEGNDDCLDQIVGEAEDPAAARRAFLKRLRERCAEIYSKYLAILEEDPEIRAFERDPKSYLDRFRERFSRRSELALFWNADRKGSLYDLLYDKPSFIEDIYKSRQEKDTWPEAKADYFLAHEKLKDFRAAFDQVVSVVGNREVWQEEMQRLEYVVNGLANLINIRNRLIEIYSQSGRPEQLNKAVVLAKDLYAYDPMSPSFMAMYVEGTIRAIRNPPAPPDEQVKEAQRVAIRIRELVKKYPAKFAKEYWLSFCQILEISKYFGDTGDIQRSLQQKLRAGLDPARALVVPGTNRAEDGQAVDIAKRFLELFDTEGIRLRKPYRIELNESGQAVFIRSDTRGDGGAGTTSGDAEDADIDDDEEEEE